MGVPLAGGLVLSLFRHSPLHNPGLGGWEHQADIERSVKSSNLITEFSTNAGSPNIPVHRLVPYTSISWWIRNPFKSVHACALVNAGEMAAGLAVMTATQTSSPPIFKALVQSLDAEFLKKARGTLTVLCSLGKGKGATRLEEVEEMLPAGASQG